MSEHTTTASGGWVRPRWSVWAWRVARVTSFVGAFLIGRFVL